MSYDIIVRFPSKEMADAFCSQMSDGFGEGYCDFSSWLKKEGTNGKNVSDFEKIVEDGKKVFFVNDVFNGD